MYYMCVYVSLRMLMSVCVCMCVCVCVCVFWGSATLQKTPQSFKKTISLGQSGDKPLHSKCRAVPHWAREQPGNVLIPGEWDLKPLRFCIAGNQLKRTAGEGATRHYTIQTLVNGIIALWSMEALLLMGGRRWRAGENRFIVQQIWSGTPICVIAETNVIIKLQ